MVELKHIRTASACAVLRRLGSEPRYPTPQGRTCSWSLGQIQFVRSHLWMGVSYRLPCDHASLLLLVLMCAAGALMPQAHEALTHF